jgi:hypothetical protein
LTVDFPLDINQVELAPTKQRITAVRQWLEEAMTGIPAGVDKETSFSDIAKERIRKYRVGLCHARDTEDAS